MIAIVDSGSTKSDWIILEKEGEEVFRTKTMGFNPYFLNSKDIIKELKNNESLMEIVDNLTHIFFYGAGCSAPHLNKIVEDALKATFSKAEIIVDHDLLGAAYAAYNGKPAVVCILGTGSNSCYFDGNTLREETPSLAFILGDEGSGNNLGKRLLQAYFLKKMPKHLSRAFDERYGITINDLNENVYKSKFANKYLATFSRFVADHKYEPFIQKLVYESLREFFINQVLPYPEARNSEINFIGSVAYYYEETLKSVAAEFHLNIGVVVRKPIDSLVQYHKLYILPDLNQVKV
ncbi:MAG: BadF/BadG/BcrA/BcrD ATPase family protein [Flavobacteriales bacterium]